MNPFQKRSKAGSLLELFLDSSLLLLFIGQTLVLGCLLTYGYLPLPLEWTNRHITNYLPEGLSLEAESIRLKLNGEVELVNVQLWSASLQQPLFTSNRAMVHLDLPSAGEFKPTVRDLVVSNGTLYLPAVYSPDGLRRPLLEKSAFRLIPDPEMIRIDSFAALLNSVHLRGAIEWPILEKEDQQEGIPISERISDFYGLVANGLKEQDRFGIFTTPTLSFRLAANDDRSVKLSAVLSSKSMKHAFATGEDFRAEAEFIVAGEQVTAESDLHISAKLLEIPGYQIRCDGLDAVIQQDQWGSVLQGEVPDLDINSSHLSVFGVDLDAPLLKIHAVELPRLSFSGATQGLQGAVTLNGTADVHKQKATIRARGSVDLLSLVPEEIAGKLPALDFAQAPYYDLKLDFAHGFDLESAELNVDAYGVSVKGLTFDYIDAYASYKDNVYSLDTMYLRRDWQWLDLTFLLDAESWDYKVSLIGSADPNDYNAILPHWWEGIFRSFDFSQVGENLGDFIIYGNTKASAADLFYGYARAKNASFMDVLVDDASLVVRGRGRYAEVIDIDAHSGGGWAKGGISFASRKDGIRAPVSIRMSFDTQMRLEDTQKFFGENIQSILSDFETGALPHAQLEGVIYNKAYPQFKGRSYFDLRASCTEPLVYKSVPLDSLSFSLYGRSEVTHLRDLEFGFADGDGGGSIDIFTPQGDAAALRYQIRLVDADQGQAIRNLPQLDTVETDLTAAELTKEDSQGRESGRIDVSLHAEGPVDRPHLHLGYGSLNMLNDQLGAIQLFGPLSRLLKDTKFSFTSFNLEQMAAVFRMKDGVVTFDELQIDGPRTSIQAPGTLTLEDETLNMRVSVNLFANVGSDDSAIKKVGDMITKPIPNLLIFELTGTVKKQKWRSVYDPRNLLPIFGGGS